MIGAISTEQQVRISGDAAQLHGLVERTVISSYVDVMKLIAPCACFDGDIVFFQYLFDLLYYMM